MKLGNYSLLIIFLSTFTYYSVQAQTCNPGGPAGTRDFFTVCEGGTSYTGTDYELTIGNNKTVIINGDVTLSGTLTINLVGSTSRLLIQAPNTLTAGSIVFTGSATGKVIEVESGATIDVSGNIDFGNLDIELDGEGDISAGSISGAGNTSCEGVSTCPTFDVPGSCDPPTGLCSEDALPIELTLFEVEKIENTVEITWVTATEENNDYFTLDRSRNGREYQTLTVVEGAGTSFDPLSYSFVDENPLFGQSYYRLSQTDYDGTSETFSPVGIYIAGFSDVTVYPNPVNKGEQLTVNHTAQEGEQIEVTLFSPAGISVMSKTLSAGDYTMDLDKNLQTGFYMLKIKSGSKQVIQRLLIN